jgi:DNA-binding transcriptional ArsR family regulator
MMAIIRSYERQPQQVQINAFHLDELERMFYNGGKFRNRLVTYFMRRDVFQAIADPNRRAIIGLLADQKLTLSGVAEHFDISRPAISKHIKILAQCGLVVVHRQGRESYCEARLEKLNEVSDWVEQYRKLWEQRFERLDEYLSELQKKERKHGEK